MKAIERAFPCRTDQEHRPFAYSKADGEGHTAIVIEHPGMDLRTYIATQVFSAMLADLTDMRSNSDMADDAVIRTDALIEALNKKP